MGILWLSINTWEFYDHNMFGWQTACLSSKGGGKTGQASTQKPSCFHPNKSLHTNKPFVLVQRMPKVISLISVISCLPT